MIGRAFWRKPLLVILLLGLSCSAGAQTAVVAITEFDNEANTSPSHLATLRSRITDNLVNTRKFQVVERQNLSTVLSERRLAESGVTSAENAPEGGKVVGAGYVVYGSVLSLGHDSSATRVGGLTSARRTAKVELQLRIADAETSKILASKTVVGLGSQARMSGEGQTVSSNLDVQVLDDALRDAAQAATEALMDLAFPAKVLRIANGQLTINLSQEATSVGTLYQVWRLDEELIDPDTGESLGAAEELVGEVKIVSCQPRFALAEPVEGSGISDFAVGMIARRVNDATLKEREAKEREESQRQFQSRF